jgi:hypothetical protein
VVGSYLTVEGIKFEVGQDKGSVEARVARGVQVESLAPQSTLYQEVEIQAGVDSVVSDTKALKGGRDAYATALAAFKKARAELAALTGHWDRSYDVLLAAGEKHCSTADEGTGLGLTVRLRTSHVFAMPVSVAAKYDPARSVLRIHVKRAPGTHSLCVQVSRELGNLAAWEEMEGDGAIHVIKNPAPGTWWVRAQSRRAKARSEFTTPVSVFVR